MYIPLPPEDAGVSLLGASAAEQSTAASFGPLGAHAVGSVLATIQHSIFTLLTTALHDALAAAYQMETNSSIYKLMRRQSGDSGLQNINETVGIVVGVVLGVFLITTMVLLWMYRYSVRFSHKKKRRHRKSSSSKSSKASSDAEAAPPPAEPAA